MEGMTVPAWYRIAARIRGVSAVAFFVCVLVAALARLPELVVPAFVLLAINMATTLAPVAPSIEPITVASPVRGRWVALNSPATKRPSHGTHSLGQTFAIDLVHEPAPGDRPAFGAGPGFRPPEDFPGFGQPVLAPADATVVRVYDGARDHLSRLSWTGYFYLVAEGLLREAAGPRFLLGNHVVLDLGGNVFAVVAHLRRGSVEVTVGDRVTAGQQLAGCGNSGNSSEPHVHFQLMDSRRPPFAAGLPFQFADGVPADREALIA